MKIFIKENWDKAEFWWLIAATRHAIPLTLSPVYNNRADCIKAAEAAGKKHGLEVCR